MSSMLRQMPQLPKRFVKAAKLPALLTNQASNEDGQERTISRGIDVGTFEKDLRVTQSSDPPTSDVKQNVRKLWSKVGNKWDHIKLLLGRNSWKMVDRRAFAFRVSWYCAIPFVLISSIYTLYAASQYTNDANRIPYLSQGVAVLSLFAPAIGVVGALQLRANLILIATAMSALLLVAYRIALLVRLNVGGISIPDVEVKESEIAFSICNLIFGVIITFFGIFLYRKTRQLLAHSRGVLLLGLDNSGKSSLMHHVLPLPEGVHRIDVNPTAGLGLFHFRKWDTLWKVWDMSGQGRNRRLWPSFFSLVQAIIFVVDCSDGKRIGVAKDELYRIMQHPSVRERSPVLLILANKMDKADGTGVASIVQLRSALRVDGTTSGMRVKMLVSSGLSGTGVLEGFQWIKNQTEFPSVQSGAGGELMQV